MLKVRYPMETAMEDLTPVTAAVTPDLPDNWDMHRIAAFVRDVAVNLYPIEKTLQKHGISVEQFALLKNNDFFKKALECALIEWNSPQSTQKRLAMEAAIALEDAMPVIAARMHKTTESMRDLVEVAKLFAKMAGVGETTQQSSPSEKFSVVINLGGDKQVFDKSRQLTVIPDPGSPSMLIEGNPDDNQPDTGTGVGGRIS
jgi:hypothetical protein